MVTVDVHGELAVCGDLWSHEPQVLLLPPVFCGLSAYILGKKGLPRLAQKGAQGCPGHLPGLRSWFCGTVDS